MAGQQISGGIAGVSRTAVSHQVDRDETVRSASGPSSWREKARAEQELPWMRTIGRPTPSDSWTAISPKGPSNIVVFVMPISFAGAFSRLNGMAACGMTTLAQ